MEGQAKLTRTQSSLLRSSPSVRSSITEMDSAVEVDEEDQKPHRQRPGPKSSAAINPPPSSFRWLPLFAVATAALLLSCLYLKTEMEISASENLLLALVLVAIGLFLAGKNKKRIERSLLIFRQIYNENSKKLRFSNNRTRSSVQWYIGCERREKPNGSGRRCSLLSSPEPEAREGVEFYSNGDVYEGEFHKGKCNGSGVYTYFVNGRYEGDWVDGKYDGYGIESWARGSRYRGQYRQGLRHGVGVYRFFTGDSYAGEWCSGQYHGVGVQTCSDGSCYAGEFKYGVKHGLGCYHFRNGDRYAGEYFGDKIHGFGVYHFANGHRYEGSWHEGRKQGYGVYTFRKGETKCGEWNCGTLKTPFPLHTDAAVLGSVQSARKAGENAIHLRQVDELVNKSVMAANRAATAARVAGIRAVQNTTAQAKC